MFTRYQYLIKALRLCEPISPSLTEKLACRLEISPICIVNDLLMAVERLPNTL